MKQDEDNTCIQFLFRLKKNTHIHGFGFTYYGEIISGRNWEPWLPLESEDWGQGQEKDFSLCALLNTLIFIQRKCITYSKNGHSDIYRTLASSLSGLRTQQGYGGGEKTICQIALPLHPSPDSLLEIAVHLKRKHLNKRNESCGCPVSLTLTSHRHFLQGRQKDSFVKFDILNVPLLQGCLHLKKN